MDLVIKLIQIITNIVTVTIALFTYLSIKKNLLNSVNNEYQKKVLAKLEQLSDLLIEEFDMDSKFHLNNYDYINESLFSINSDFIKHIESGIEKLEFKFLLPTNKQVEYLRTLSIKIKSDPFIPLYLKQKICKYWDLRRKYLNSICNDELNNYIQDLAHGNYNPTSSLDNLDIINNSINLKLHYEGFDIEGVEEQVHNLRKEIQNYYHIFIPVKNKKLF
jgi:hypothetical protein